MKSGVMMCRKHNFRRQIFANVQQGRRFFPKNNLRFTQNRQSFTWESEDALSSHAIKISIVIGILKKMCTTLKKYLRYFFNVFKS